MEGQTDSQLHDNIPQPLTLLQEEQEPVEPGNAP